MIKAKKWCGIVITTTLTALLLSACGGQSNREEATAGKQEAEGAAVTQTYTDWTGHTVQVPTHPKRIIFHGETTGDLAVLGIDPIGILKESVKGTPAEQRFSEVEDMGFPLNVEKATTLNPDLIIIGNADEKQYETISNVAPTVTFDTFASLDERLRLLGQLLNKQEEAQQWLAMYKEQEAAMWSKIREGGIAAGETATVFTMYPGERLFIMARTGLTQILYSEQGMKPTPLVQDALDQDLGFLEISMEVIPEYAGDHIFVLTPLLEDAAKEMEELQNSKLWQSLEAVKKGKVYTFGITEAYSDALSRERLVEQLPAILLR